MIKLSAIILLASLVYYTQCLPAQTQAGTETESDNKLQLYVSNGTQGLNYHLSAVVSDLESEDQQINAELNAILPFINFLFDANGEGKIGDCLDQLEIQLVHDKPYAF